MFFAEMKPKANKMLDAHIHSTFSDGELTPEQIKKVCSKKKVDAGICDRVSKDNPTVNSEKTFIKYIGTLDKVKVQKSALFDIGCGIRLSEELVDRLDYVVRGLNHFKTRQSDSFVSFEDPKAVIKDIDYFREWTMDQFTRTIEMESVDIIAHPTLLPACLREEGLDVFTDEWKSRLIKLASKEEVAFEINNRWQVPDEEFITECLKLGVSFALGSDGGTKDEVGDLAYPLEMVEKYEIPEFLIFPNNDISFDAF